MMRKLSNFLLILALVLILVGFGVLVAAFILIALGGNPSLDTAIALIGSGIVSLFLSFIIYQIFFEQ